MFPSWSPIGWAKDNTERRIIFNGLSDIRTVLVRTEQGIDDLPSLIPELSMGTSDIPGYRQLDVETANVEIHQIRLTAALVSNYLVALRFDQTSHGIVAPHWDIDPRELGDTPTLKAALLHTVARLDPFIKDTSMLLLRDHGSHYERVGYLTMEDEDFERQITETDATDRRRDILFKFNDDDSYLEPKDWWRRHFQKETVIIGIAAMSRHTTNQSSLQPVPTHDIGIYDCVGLLVLRLPKTPDAFT